MASLTAKAIAKLDVGTHYDERLKGFGLRVGPTASTWFVEYRPGAGGRAVAKKRIKIGRTDKLTADQARDAAEKLLATVALGSDPATARAEERASSTVSDLADSFMTRHVTPKRKASSAAYYQHVIDTHITPSLGSQRATNVSRGEVAKMHDTIAKKRSGARTKGGPFVANRAVAILSAMYGWAGRVGLVPEGTNPASGVERFEESNRERFLTTDEMQRLGEALRLAETTGLPYSVDETKAKAKHAPKAENRRTVFSPHVTGAVRLLMLTGCRLREILHLEWDHIDFERGIAFLPDSKTGKKAVVLSSAAVGILGTLPRVGRYVIASDSAGTDHEKPRADLKKPWAALCRHAGLAGLRLHDLRHTFASVGAGGGLGLPIIGSLLGHSDSKTTQRYAHLHVDPVRAAADEIAGKIDAAIGGR